MKTLEEIHGMNIKELQEEIKDSERKVFEIRIRIEVAQEKDTSKNKKMKRYIARLKTVLKEKQSANEMAEA